MKSIKKWSAGLLILILLAGLIAVPGIAQAKSSKKIGLNQTSVTLTVGKTTTLKLKNAPKGKKVVWSSSDKKIAAVSKKGKVTAKKSGTAVITAKCEKKSYKCKVTVRQTCLNATAITLKYGEKAALKLLYTEAKVAWFSSNKKIAYADGKKVYAKAVGEAVITAKCNGKSYQCKITVRSGENEAVTEDGIYTSKDKVAAYIHTYNRLPKNFITKAEAKALGWTGGSLIPYAPYKCIGGDIYANYEKTLPVKEGRIYYECDIDTLGALERGAKRLVYSNDGLVYYTEDHYAAFVRLYGTE